MWKCLEQRAKRLVRHVLLAGLGFLPAIAAGATWLTDLPAAQATAKAQGKIVLVDFTGSDWCGWCMRLNKEVFSTAEFDAFASANLVLVEMDFPRHKDQSAALRMANATFYREFQITGFPTLIVLEGDGKQLGRLGYRPGGPQPFIEELTRISGKKAPAGKQPKSSELPPLPPFNAAPTAPPHRFNDVSLKGISSLNSNRLAVINNKSLSEGESALVKVGDAHVKVKCIEIREASVLVSVDGAEPRELRMRGGL